MCSLHHTYVVSRHIYSCHYYKSYSLATLRIRIDREPPPRPGPRRIPGRSSPGLRTRLVDVERGARADLAALLEVALRGVPGQGDVLHLPSGQLL